VIVHKIELWQLTDIRLSTHDDGTICLLSCVGDEQVATVAVLNTLSCLLGVEKSDVSDVDCGQKIFQSPALIGAIRDIFEQVLREEQIARESVLCDQNAPAKAVA
jgi:hypothetical protein